MRNFLVFFVVFCNCSISFSIHVKRNLKTVPIRTLIQNQKSKKKFVSKFEQAAVEQRLGRLYSMLYATTIKDLSVHVEDSDEILFSSELVHAGNTPRYMTKVDSALTESSERKDYLSKALEHFKKADQLEKDNLVTKIGLGWTYLELKQPQEARIHLKSVLDKIEKEFTEDSHRGIIGKFIEIPLNEKFQWAYVIADGKTIATFRPLTEAALALLKSFKPENIENYDDPSEFYERRDNYRSDPTDKNFKLLIAEIRKKWKPMTLVELNPYSPKVTTEWIIGFVNQLHAASQGRVIQSPKPFGFLSFRVSRKSKFTDDPNAFEISEDFTWRLEKSEKSINIGVYHDVKSPSRKSDLKLLVSSKEGRLENSQSFELPKWLDENFDTPPENFSLATVVRPSSLGEVSEYYIATLDSKKDDKELKKVIAKAWIYSTIAGHTRWITPLAVDLSGRRDPPVDSNLKVTFDLIGDKSPDQWSWIRPTAAWLVYLDNVAEPISGVNLFGNSTFWIFWNNGFEPLCALDSNNDRKLSGSELAKLYFWRDSDSNGVSSIGEVISLIDYGVSQVKCDFTRSNEGLLWNAKGIGFHDGRHLPLYDILLEKVPATSSAIN